MLLTLILCAAFVINAVPLVRFVFKKARFDQPSDMLYLKSPFLTMVVLTAISLMWLFMAIREVGPMLLLFLLLVGNVLKIIRTAGVMFDLVPWGSNKSYVFLSHLINLEVGVITVVYVPMALIDLGVLV
jgi:hypothetical protein